MRKVDRIYECYVIELFCSTVNYDTHTAPITKTFLSLLDQYHHEMISLLKQSPL